MIALSKNVADANRLEQRIKAGKALRQAAPRSSHADWKPSADRTDPVDVLEQSNQGRLPELTPIRYGRMLKSPFAFLRGSAAVMAGDLARTPSSGLSVQACGDCHLANFGLFATPERNLLFDVNDFDETLTAPWEWDVKRLAASLVVAGRENGFSDEQCGEITQECVQSYRRRLYEFAELSPLEIWYFRVDAKLLIESAPDAESKMQREEMAAKARGRIGERMLPKMTKEVDGRRRFVENPPIMTRETDEACLDWMKTGIDEYRGTLSEDRRLLLDNYRIEDFARRVVGVGSVGTRCFVALLVCDDSTPLLLQIKEARPSVLEPFAAPCPWEHQGRRVVVGQRIMQAASDLFLGWFRAADGREYYVRQLRDMKFSIPVDRLEPRGLHRYAETCGWTLARAHAKSGVAGQIAGYLGRNDKFDVALRTFARAYADQTEQDHAALAQARRSGRVVVEDAAETPPVKKRKKSPTT